jgi:glycosyltransferase involved in cell wall biosynthesis
MQRILYIADPNMIHDLKWISFFSAQSNDYQVFMLVRKCHADLLGQANFAKIEAKYQLKILGIINDFSIRHFCKTMRQARQIRQYLSDNKIDIFHVMYAEPNSLWANIRLPAHILPILTTRGTDVLQTIPDFFEKKTIIARLAAFFYRRAFGRFAHITGTSTRQLQAVARLAPSTKANLLLVRTGIDVAALDAPPAATPPLNSNKKIIFFPRAMRPLYNHELALQACALLSPDLQAKYQLVFVNRDNPDTAYVAKIAAALEDQKMDFSFLPQLPPAQLFSLYRQAAAVVMCPLSDGTPVSALEAMAVSAPLILSPLAYDADLFAPDAVCILPDWQPQSLANAISNILLGTANIDSQKAARLARQLANRDTEMKKLANLYNSHL